MRLVFVRHGHPNYALDCLTKLGHQQAEAAADRLMGERIEEIHASSCGRAVETAHHTADKLRLPVITHDFMREISWGSIDGSEIPFGGHPWLITEEMIKQGQSVMLPDWRTDERFCHSKLIECADKVAQGIDGWLQSLGYEREGLYYRVKAETTNRTVAMFSHGGASTAALSHMLNLPIPYLCTYIRPDFTGITVLRLGDEPGQLTTPVIEICNDARHIRSGKATYDR